MWKIEGRKEGNIISGNKHIELFCNKFPNFREKIYYFKNIIDNIDDNLAIEFIKKLWDKDSNDFNYECINKYIQYIEK